MICKINYKTGLPGFVKMFLLLRFGVDKPIELTIPVRPSLTGSSIVCYLLLIILSLSRCEVVRYSGFYSLHTLFLILVFEYLYTMKFLALILFCFIIACSGKENLPVYHNSCVECTNYNPKIVIDTCSNIQDLQAFVIQMQRMGYTCITKKLW
jgi:hypothetical protein